MDSNGTISDFLGRFRFRRGLAFGVIIITALLAFEIFNYSTTDYALRDLLGDLSFLGISWATILAIAFCGIDFAGIARLFSPGSGSSEQNEVWYLFGAWLLAATMNAMLTWWGVSLAVMNHQTLGNEVIARATLLRIVPIFVAVLVWLIRVLIIGSFSVAGENLFGAAEQRLQPAQKARPAAGYGTQPAPAPVRPLGGYAGGRPTVTPTPAAASSSANKGSGRPYRPAPKPAQSDGPAREPTYQPDFGLSAAPREAGNGARSGSFSSRNGSPRNS